MPKASWYSAIMIFLFWAAAFNSSAQVNYLHERVSGWSSDIDTMLSLMKTQHYIYRSNPLPQQLLKDAKILKTKISQYSDERMLGELERLMFYMHDGHSYILPVARNINSFYLPVHFYIFSDGVYIIDADKPNKDLIGCKVESIHGVAVTKLVNDMNAYIHHDNIYTVKWLGASVLRFRSVYEWYGLPAGSSDITINLIDKNNNAITRKLSFIPATDFHGIPKLFSNKLQDNISAPLYLSNVTDNYWFKVLPEKKVFYFQFNQVYDKDNETIAAFALQLDSALQIEKPKLFIIDVRHNNGGNSGLLPPLLDVIKQFERANSNSKIIVITGRNTFSAAQIFISLINKETHALFAGEPSSSSPNFVGEENYILLPFSGAMGSISNKYHETIAGDRRKFIEPDYPVFLSSTAYFKNQDPVIEFILTIK